MLVLANSSRLYCTPTDGNNSYNMVSFGNQRSMPKALMALEIVNLLDPLDHLCMRAVCRGWRDFAQDIHTKYMTVLDLRRMEALMGTEKNLEVRDLLFQLLRTVPDWRRITILDIGQVGSSATILQQVLLFKAGLGRRQLTVRASINNVLLFVLEAFHKRSPETHVTLVAPSSDAYALADPTFAKSLVDHVSWLSCGSQQGAWRVVLCEGCNVDYTAKDSTCKRCGANVCHACRFTCGKHGMQRWYIDTYDGEKRGIFITTYYCRSCAAPPIVCASVGCLERQFRCPQCHLDPQACIDCGHALCDTGYFEDTGDGRFTYKRQRCCLCVAYGTNWFFFNRESRVTKWMKNILG